jgi:hypothetical protein
MIKKLWCEKYRPAKLSEYVFRDSVQQRQIEAWVKEKYIPHLLFSGSPGVCKTTLAKILVNELEIDNFDFLELNASRENSVDTIRDKIVNFVESIPFGPFKVVLLDECLEENTEVVVLREGQEQLIKIKDVNELNDLVKSFNVEKCQIEWKPFKLFDKGIQETLEIEFENGEIVICTPDHKWYVEINGVPTVVKARDLHKYSSILTA